MPLLSKTVGQVKESLSEAVAMPVRQSFVVSVIAVILAVVALIVAVRK